MVNVYWKGSHVVILRRAPDGGIIRSQQPAEHCCFIRQADASDALKCQLRQSKFVLGMRDEPHGWLRIRWADRGVALRAALEMLPEKYEVTAYEGDVNPVRRWLVESEAPIARPRRVYLDLENDSRVPPVRALRGNARILCWALADDHGWAKHRLLDEDTDLAEADLLAKLWREFERFDQVVAWGGDRYDFPMLRARTELRRIQVDPKRWLWLDHLELYERMDVMAAESGDQKQNMKLDSVARHLLGEERGKIVDADVSGAQTWEAWEEGGDRRRRLGHYCERDATLMPGIEAKSGYIELLQTVCEVCGCLPDTVGTNPSVQVETFLMRLGSRRGIRYGTRDPNRDYEIGDQFRGALVLAPKRRGILRDVHVADFSRQYPSAIISWNMSPDTLVEKPPPLRGGIPIDACPIYLSHLPVVHPTRGEGVAEAPITGVWFDQRKEGTLSKAVADLVQLRAEWDEKKKHVPARTPPWNEADRRSTAYKIVANSFPGVVGMKHGRLYNRDVAESVSQAGVWLIKNTIKAAEERGFEVVYSDTDSAFVAGCTRAEFEAFVATCNEELYPRILKAQGCERNTVKLAFEKSFERIILIGKKRYAAKMSHFKGQPASADSKPEIKGLEFKRGDTARAARHFQERIILQLLDGCEDPEVFDAMVVAERERILTAKLARDDIVLTKRLGKAAKSFVRKTKKDGSAAALPAHVEVALILAKRGVDVGEGARIDYLVVDAEKRPMTCAPAVDWDEETGKVSVQRGGRTELVDFDRFYLWEDLIFPPTMRVLEPCFPAHDWNRHLDARPKLQARVRKGVAAAVSRGVQKRRAAEQAGQMSLLGGMMKPQ